MHLLYASYISLVKCSLSWCALFHPARSTDRPSHLVEEVVSQFQCWKGSGAGAGCEEQGSEGQIYKESGSEGQGREGQGCEGQGCEGQGSEGPGYEGQGSEGQGCEGQGCWPALRQVLAAAVV